MYYVHVQAAQDDYIIIDIFSKYIYLWSKTGSSRSDMRSACYLLKQKQIYCGRFAPISETGASTVKKRCIVGVFFMCHHAYNSNLKKNQLKIIQEIFANIHCFPRTIPL